MAWNRGFDTNWGYSLGDQDHFDDPDERFDLNDNEAVASVFFQETQSSQNSLLGLDHAEQDHSAGFSQDIRRNVSDLTRETEVSSQFDAPIPRNDSGFTQPTTCAEPSASYFACTQPDCGKRCKSKSAWKKHETEQHGARVYFCTRVGCGEEFKRNYVAKKHKKEKCKFEIGTEADDPKNGYGCGFCAEFHCDKWNERCKHIMDLHFGTVDIPAWDINLVILNLFRQRAFQASQPLDTTHVQYRHWPYTKALNIQKRLEGLDLTLSNHYIRQELSTIWHEGYDAEQELQQSSQPSPEAAYQQSPPQTIIQEHPADATMPPLQQHIDPTALSSDHPWDEVMENSLAGIYQLTHVSTTGPSPYAPFDPPTSTRLFSANIYNDRGEFEDHFYGSDSSGNNTSDHTVRRSSTDAMMNNDDITQEDIQMRNELGMDDGASQFTPETNHDPQWHSVGLPNIWW
ncbi:hypothetical protein MMC25_002163 [Agyrium rufum]|nr:hypothetical protein [Agyrium rufum]